MLRIFKNISVLDYSNVRLLSGEQQNDRECSNRGQSQKDELMQFQKTFETDEEHYPTVSRQIRKFLYCCKEDVEKI